MAEDFPAPNLDGLVDKLVSALYDPANIKRLERAMTNAQSTAMTIAGGVGSTVGAVLAPVVAAALKTGQSAVEPALAPVLAELVGHALGVNVSASEISEGAPGQGQSAISKTVTNILFDTMRPPGDTIEPSEDGARRFMGMLANITFAGWFQSVMIEFIMSCYPGVEPVESIGQLAENIVHGMGMSRIARRVFGPYVDVLVTTPLTWKMNKQYRTQLLTPSDAVLQFTRERLSREEVYEICARQGWSDEAIELFMAKDAKRLGVSQLAVLERYGAIGRDEAVLTLRDSGYDDQAASKFLNLEQITRIWGIQDNVISPAVAAYVDRRLDDGELDGVLAVAVPNDKERKAWHDTARAQRALNTKRLTPAQVEACVKSKILNVADYRDALEREGYPPDDVAALELLLRQALDAKAELAELKATQAAEHAAAAKAKADADAAKKAALEQERALARQGKLSDLERAVVRGLIPIARYEEIARASYDDDTVAMLAALVEDERQQYLDAQQRRDDAAKKAAIRSIDESSLRQAVVRGIVTLDDYKHRLEAAGLAPDDVTVLVSLLDDQMHDAAAAAAKRADAVTAAAKRGIDLTRFETLVRQGIRTLDAYDAELKALGYDDADRADLVELLRQRIAQDDVATKAHAAAAAALQAKGVSLAEFEAAVVKGVRSLDDYETFLRSQGFAADARLLLMDTMHAQLDELAAAKAKRAEVAAATAKKPLPFATVERAARLGVISPDEFRTYLAGQGYSDDDQALLTELLLQDIATAQAARAKRQTVTAALATKQLALGQLERAVKQGVKSLDDYRAFLVGQGYSADDVETLATVLADEVAQQTDAQTRRAAVIEDFKAIGVDLEALAADVIAGRRKVDEYKAALIAGGATAVDVRLLVALVTIEHDNQVAAAAGTG